jgi:hypothetical protein
LKQHCCNRTPTSSHENLAIDECHSGHSHGHSHGEGHSHSKKHSHGKGHNHGKGHSHSGHQHQKEIKLETAASSESTKKVGSKYLNVLYGFLIN